MRLIAALLAPSLALSLAAPVAAQTRAEVQQRARAEFRAADRNRDGTLVRGEVTRRIVQVYGSRGMTTGRSRILTNLYFQRLDADRNGRVTRAEADRAAGEAFARFDANRNGRLDPRERREMAAFLRSPGR